MRDATGVSGKCRCPRCGSDFLARPNRAASELASTLFWNYFSRTKFQQLDTITKVKCPHCSLIFSSEDVVLFGIVRAKTLRLVFGAFFAAWLTGLVWIMIWIWLDAAKNRI